MSGFDLQDLELVVTRPTSSQARVDQDIKLVVTRPTSSKARVDQDVKLVVTRPTSSFAHVLQHILLVVTKTPVTTLTNFWFMQQMQPIQRRRGLATAQQQASFLTEGAEIKRNRPIIFVVT